MFDNILKISAINASLVNQKLTWGGVLSNLTTFFYHALITR